MNAVEPVTRTSTPRLLRAGALAGPLYVVIGVAQIVSREGFDMRRHALSILTNGDLGWIQVGNFLLSGALVIAGATGARRVLRGRLGGTWGPRLLAVYGAGLIAAGIFRADPAAGFPPGATAPAAMSRSGLFHFVFGAIAFYALIGACFVFTRSFAKAGWRGWAVYSFVSGLGFLIAFAALASGGGGEATMLAFYGAVLWIWIWHTALMVFLARALE